MKQTRVGLNFLHVIENRTSYFHDYSSDSDYKLWNHAWMKLEKGYKLREKAQIYIFLQFVQFKVINRQA